MGNNYSSKKVEHLKKDKKLKNTMKDSQQKQVEKQDFYFEEITEVVTQSDEFTGIQNKLDNYQNNINSLIQKENSCDFNKEDGLWPQICEKQYQEQSKPNNVDENQNDYDGEDQQQSEPNPPKNKFLEIFVSDRDSSIRFLLDYLKNPNFHIHNLDSSEHESYIVDGDLIIKENVNEILIHIVYTLIETRLLGCDFKQFEQIRMKLNNIAQTIELVQGILELHSDQKRQFEINTKVNVSLDTLGIILSSSKYLAGEGLTLCDFRLMDLLILVKEKLPSVFEKHQILEDYVNDFVKDIAQL